MVLRFPTSGSPLALFAPLLLAAAAPAAVCLWDRDTLAAEAAGAPGVAEAIVGHFDRYPDLYYEMRLERVAREIRARPQDLALYDDAAVAVERLGRSDEAIDWMARKRAILDAQGEDADPHQEYTYLANLGTFHIHRWLHTGAERDSRVDLERGRDLLTRAIELNPDAHFGRERWQLMAVEYLIDPTFEDDTWRGTLLPMKSIPHLGQKSLEAAGYADAVEGLTGLITLGSAWESVDILRALEWALVDRGDGHLAKFAALRIEELLESGRTSVVHEVEGSEPPPFAHQHFVDQKDTASIESFYPKARESADARRERRNAFLLERLTQGEHPDTHPNFWKGWKGNPAPKLVVGPAGYASWLGSHPWFSAIVVLAAGISLIMINRRLRRRGSQRAHA